MHPDNIEFDHELSRGIITYNEEVGLWWLRQASNSVHRYAYGNIAEFIQASFPEPPQVIVDYACGAGNLLSRLHRRFPESRLIGVDGSSMLLALARDRCARQDGDSERITFIETFLPNYGLQRAMADLVVFAFPNIVPDSPDGAHLPVDRLAANDLAVARHLAEDQDPDTNREQEDPQTLFTTLVRDRLVALNIRGLLKEGGFCVRVEYGNVRREQLPELELLRTEFEEGVLDQQVHGKVPGHWFRVVASRYFRSGVMEDVYHQSGDEGDRKGGYFITVLRAI